MKSENENQFENYTWEFEPSDLDSEQKMELVLNQLTSVLEELNQVVKDLKSIN